MILRPGIDALFYVPKYLWTMFGHFTNLSRNWLPETRLPWQTLSYEHWLPSEKDFTSRLFSFLYQLTENQTGFISYVFSLLTYYHLSSYLDTWPSTRAFPSKQLLKSVVRTAVHENQTSQRRNRINYDPDFARSSNPYMDRNHANSQSEIQNFRFTCKLIASKTLETPMLCVLCDNLIFDVFSHATTSCPLLRIQHSEWWNSITDLFDVHL